MQSFFLHKYAIPATLLLVAAAIFALGANAYKSITSTDPWDGPTTISVSGTSEVMAVPDVAQFSFSVRAEGDTATVAQTASAESINAIMTFLSAQGVEERDIKTQGYNLFPRYRYEQRPCTTNFCPPGESIQDGFEVSQTITVKVRNTDNAGTLLSGVGEAGATDISSLSFSIDDTDNLKIQARNEAIADAKQQAESLAEVLGVRLVRMVNYYEDDQSYVPYYGMGGDMRMQSEAAMAPSVPMGESTVKSKVTLMYEIK
ncbi:MAG: SIMPL domain-containing protein [Candidatus Paceibacteria bacterium]